MRLIHISDPHLGYRAYNRVNREGVNAREADVFAAFRRALAKTVELDPDLILIAGDLFHVVRPSNLTIQHTFREFAGLRSKINAPVVIIGGNHDSPRAADTGCILDLFTNLPDIHVAHGEYAQVKLDKLDTSVFCLCHRALPHINSLRIEPDPSSRYNVLLAHGTVEGIIRHAYDTIEISRSQVISDSWDYVAFGHYHMFEELAPNAYYSGSLEYTSPNIWSETAKEKGFIEYDVSERRLIEFHRFPTRGVIDLRRVDAAGLSVDELNTLLQRRLESVPGGYENKIVRLVVENVHRGLQADLDYAFIRRARSEALHLELVLRPPAAAGRVFADGDQALARTLDEEWDDFARAYQLPPGVERDRFIELGREYLLRQLPSGAEQPNANLSTLNTQLSTEP